MARGGNDENRDDLEVERKRVASDKVLTVVQGERKTEEGKDKGVMELDLRGGLESCGAG